MSFMDWGSRCLKTINNLHDIIRHILESNGDYTQGNIILLEL